MILEILRQIISEPPDHLKHIRTSPTYLLFVEIPNSTLKKWRTDFHGRFVLQGFFYQFFLFILSFYHNSYYLKFQHATASSALYKKLQPPWKYNHFDFLNLEKSIVNSMHSMHIASRFKTRMELFFKSNG